jgi:hypothetical protein
MSLDASISEEHAAMWASIGQPKIPYGYKQIYGQLQKGDAVWNGEKFVRVKKCYPFVGDNWGLPTRNAVAIRRCQVVQEALPGVASNTPTDPQPGEARGVVGTQAEERKARSDDWVSLHTDEEEWPT